MAKIQVCLSVLALVLVTSSKAQTGESPKQPNIIFVQADDLGFSDIGYHNPEIPTPHLVSLANQGVILENYYVSAICTPSRACLMSGRYEIHTGLSHSVIQNTQPGALPDDSPIISEKLKEVGYSTHMIGKWHLGFYENKWLPHNRGFDTFFGIYGGGADHYNYTSPATYSMSPNNPKYFDLHDQNGDVYSETGRYSTELYTEKAVNVIENHNQEQPLFMYLSYQAPHTPLEVPKRYSEAYEKNTHWSKKRRQYAGMVAALDEGVENITRALKDQDLWENTILIYATDNGGDPYSGADNYPLRGRKNTLWEGGVRGVGFVSGGAVKQRGVINKDLIHVTDWFPTLVGVAGGNTDDTLPLDGVDQWATISEGSPGKRDMLLHNIDILTPRYGDPLYDDTFDTSINAAIRVGDLKLVTGTPMGYFGIEKLDGFVSFISSFTGIDNKNVWLFNITADPSELNDISDESPGDVRNLLDRLDGFLKTAVTPLYPDPDPAAIPVPGGVWRPWR